jgi:hypothetical protein
MILPAPLAENSFCASRISTAPAARQEHIDAHIEDMEWLGLKHDGEVVFQSQRIAGYAPP